MNKIKLNSQISLQSTNQKNSFLFFYLHRESGGQLSGICAFTFFNFFSANKQVNLYLLWTKCFGLQDIKIIIIIKWQLKSQREWYSHKRRSCQKQLMQLKSSLFCFLCPAAVPLLSMSQISNDRRVCAGCTKRACLWQFPPASKFLDDGIAHKWKLLSNAESLVFTYKYLTAEFKFDVTSRQTLHQAAF